MHPALQIHEVLLNIFRHCRVSLEMPQTADLVALARTCRAFKDPALNVLWEELANDLSPLVRCLPNVCHRLPDESYSCPRSLTGDEWDVLRSYTRRIRSIGNLYGLDREAAQRLWRTPEPQLLFPNLRHLKVQYSRKAVQLLLIPFPSLTSLDIQVCTLRLLEDSLKSLSKNSPCLRELRIHPHRLAVNIDHFDTTFIRQWRHLQVVLLPHFFLDIVTVVHLSHMSALTQLEFKIGDTFPDRISPFDTPLIFSRLTHLTLHSESLNSISRLLSWMRLVVVESFSASIERCPSRPGLLSFLASARTSNLCHTTCHLALSQNYVKGHTYVHENRPTLDFQHLRPFMEFPNLRSIHLDLEWNVDLMDSELLSVVSVWPHLGKLWINVEWGWNSPGGITPNGLVQLVQACPSLTTFALAVDTRGYTTVPPSVTLTSSSLEYVFPVGSHLEEESILAIAAFFADTNYMLCVGATQGIRWLPNWEVYHDRWQRVFQLLD